jgi:hypothetical protein
MRFTETSNDDQSLVFNTRPTCIHVPRFQGYIPTFVFDVEGIDFAAYTPVVSNPRKWCASTATATAKEDANNAAGACPFTMASYLNYNPVYAEYFYKKLYPYHSQHTTCVPILLSGKRYKYLAYTRFWVQTRKLTIYTRQTTYVERYTAARSRNVYTSSAIVAVWNNFTPIQRYGDIMLPAIIRCARVFMWSAQCLRLILTEFQVSRVSDIKFQENPSRSVGAEEIHAYRWTETRRSFSRVADSGWEQKINRQMATYMTPLKNRR